MAANQEKMLDEMVAGLREAAGSHLLSVILYGAEARGDHYEKAQDLYLLIVLDDLELATLALVRGPLAHWLKKGNPMPRFFSPEIIADAADVFPMELLDIAGHHKVLAGEDPFESLQVDDQHLRLQCERELREKLMRLQEAYVAARGKARELERLVAESYMTFVDIFRGCLRLHEVELPARAADVVSKFCQVTDLDPAPFRAADELARSGRAGGPIDDLFSSYYKQLVGAARAVDEFGGNEE